MECQVQRCYDNYTACAEALKESDFEREKLEMERQRLVQRIHEVDTDRTKVSLADHLLALISFSIILY